MTQHICRGGWVDGKLDHCPNHKRQTAAPDVSPFNDRRTRLRIDGVAKTGQVSPKGTVEHTDYWSGRMAVTAKPAAINVILSEMPWFRDHFVYRDGEWVQRATGKAIAWTQKSRGSKPNSTSPNSKTSSSKPKPMAPTAARSVPTSNGYGVSIGRSGVSLQASNPQP